MVPGLDLYYSDRTQPLTTAREELGDLDNDLSEVFTFSISLDGNVKTVWVLISIPRRS